MARVSVWQRLWREFGTAEDFSGKPYLALLNQVGHTFLGLLAAQVFCDLWFVVTGEMPVRLHIFFPLFAIYLFGVEHLWQRFRGSDSWNDTLFFLLGVAGALLPFTETGFDEWTAFLAYSVWKSLALKAAWLAYLIYYLRGIAQDNNGA